MSLTVCRAWPFCSSSAELLDHGLCDGLGTAGVLPRDQSAVLDDVGVKRLVGEGVLPTALLQVVLQSEGDGLAALSELMFDAMGIPAGGTDAAWRSAAEAWFRAQLEQPACFAAFVVDDPLLGVVSAACGILDARAPGPRGLSVVRGHVFSIATDSSRRRRGHARACLTALVAWFRLDTDAETVELSATSDGVELYTSLGFRERAHPTMRLGLSAPTETFL
jgi:ribosomal protein S18 acetylase RimI-like enzyme